MYRQNAKIKAMRLSFMKDMKLKNLFIITHACQALLCSGWKVGRRLPLRRQRPVRHLRRSNSSKILARRPMSHVYTKVTRIRINTNDSAIS